MADLRERLQEGLVGRYRLERELGRGGMATVYLAHDLRHDRPVALKVLHPELASTVGPERFQREIRLAARLQHPHILTVLDSGDARGQLWFTMPFVDGESLRKRLRRERELSLGEALRITREVGQALQYAHEHGVIHRDIKPENLLLTRDGNTMVADFGVARALSGGDGQPTLTETGMAVGTPTYMSPEQANGERAVDARTDVYSLGTVLYEMLAGEPPYTGPTALAIIAKRVTLPVPSMRTVRPSVPEAVDQAVQRALAQVPSDRFPSAPEFIAALEAGTADITTTFTAGVTPTPAIAVLPFVNLSPDRENEYFSDGMTDELINALAKVPGLRVVCRTSAFAFKGKEADIRQVGQRLQVSAVLEGAVQRAGRRLRITAHLVNTADGYQLWSETYDRDMVDVFAIQDDISRTIVDTLKLKLVENARAPTEPAPRSMEAYHLYLKGRFFLGGRNTSEGLPKGIEFFQRAIALDPSYAAPHAGVAEAYHMLGVFGLLPGGEAYLKAKVAALEALKLDDLNAVAHMVLGCVALSHDWDWTSAEREFRRALELNPNEAFTHFWYAWYLTGLGRVREAVAEARRSVQLDPLVAGRLAHIGHILSLCGRDDEAIEQCAKSLELNPAGSAPFETLGWIHIRQGQYSEALAAFEKARTHLPAARMLRLGLAHALIGHTEVARQIVEEHEPLEVGVLPPGNTSYYLAAIWAALGNFDRAFAWMDRARKQRLFPMTYVKVDPLWSGLRSDPRFAELLGRMGLPS